MTSARRQTATPTPKVSYTLTATCGTSVVPYSFVVVGVASVTGTGLVPVGTVESLTALPDGGTAWPGDAPTWSVTIAPEHSTAAPPDMGGAPVFTPDLAGSSFQTA